MHSSITIFISKMRKEIILSLLNGSIEFCQARPILA